ncbi:aminoacyl-tRNA hydrolase [Aurantivibrio infirmus]
MSIKLIVGLGNPGHEYEDTRHNSGATFVAQLAHKFNASLSPETKFFGLTARARIANKDVRLLLPTTYYNNSGQAVASLANFFKISPEEILVVHDELDLPPGTARLKQGGGAGGNNGIKDIISSLGNQNSFNRLRIGIGHPGSAAQVTNYVLKKASASDRDLIEDSMLNATSVLPFAVDGEWEKAMNVLHSQTKK